MKSPEELPTPYVLWLQGKHADAIAAFRRQLAEAKEPKKRASVRDQLVVALLAYGDPSDLAVDMGKWLGDVCRETLHEDRFSPGHIRQYSIWWQTSEDWPEGALEARLTEAMNELNVARGGWINTHAKFVDLLEKARSKGEALGRDTELLDGIHEFLRLSAGFAPAIAPTSEAVARETRPRVRRFISTHAASEEPTLQAMVAWLRRRYSQLLANQEETKEKD